MSAVGAFLRKLVVSSLPNAPRDVTDDEHWRDLATSFSIRAGTVYLNHGLFGPPPDVVRYARRNWIRRLDEQPMDYFVRQHESNLIRAKQELAAFVGTENKNLVFVENAITAINTVANSFRFREHDEVLLTDHSYGAVNRAWLRATRRQGASVKCVSLPYQIESVDQVIERLLSEVTDRTRLLSISHVTAGSALVLPIKKIVAAFHSRGVLVCVDGPQALAQIEFELNDLQCDFYAASCNQWLSAPVGSGFLYVNPKHHATVQPLVKSWGRLPPETPEQWFEEFTWTGTRDPSSYLTVPVAIEFLESIGLDAFRDRTQWLASYAQSRLCELFETTPIASREHGWYGSTAHVPLPPGDWSELQDRLWKEAGIEVPIARFAGRWFIRVSCHLHNTMAQIDLLISVLGRWTR